MNDLELADLYDKSADILEDKGWCKFTLWDEQGRVCARGAMMSAMLPSPVADISWLRLADNPIEINIAEADSRFAELIGVENVATWNNLVAKDKFEVIDAFRHAAKELRNDATR